MTPSIQPKDATLGAVVTDIDLAHLNDATWSIVEDAFIELGQPLRAAPRPAVRLYGGAGHAAHAGCRRAGI